MRQWVIPGTGLGLLLLCGGILGWGDFSEAAVRLCIRVTAASSFFLFILTFSLSSLRQLLGGQRWLPAAGSRRRLGLAFALSHTFHLAAIVALVAVAYAGDISQLGDIRGGALIYLLIYLMVATSNDASQRWLGGRPWRALHKFGAYAVFIGFLSSYVSGLLRTGELHYLLYSLLALLALGLRMSAHLLKRKTNNA